MSARARPRVPTNRAASSVVSRRAAQLADSGLSVAAQSGGTVNGNQALFAKSAAWKSGKRAVCIAAADQLAVAMDAGVAGTSASPMGRKRSRGRSWRRTSVAATAPVAKVTHVGGILTFSHRFNLLASLWAPSARRQARILTNSIGIHPTAWEVAMLYHQPCGLAAATPNVAG